MLTGVVAERAAREIATRYPLTELEASVYLTIAGSVAVADEAGQAHALGCHRHAVKQALLHGETTAQGIVDWIRRQGIGS